MASSRSKNSAAQGADHKATWRQFLRAVIYVVEAFLQPVWARGRRYSVAGTLSLYRKLRYVNYLLRKSVRPEDIRVHRYPGPLAAAIVTLWVGALVVGAVQSWGLASSLLSTHSLTSRYRVHQALPWLEWSIGLYGTALIASFLWGAVDKLSTASHQLYHHLRKLYLRSFGGRKNKHGANAQAIGFSRRSAKAKQDAYNLLPRQDDLRALPGALST